MKQRALTGPGAVVVGYGPVGQTVCRLLRQQGIVPTVIELNIETVRRLNQEGIRAIYGDATQPGHPPRSWSAYCHRPRTYASCSPAYGRANRLGSSDEPGDPCPGPLRIPVAGDGDAKAPERT